MNKKANAKREAYAKKQEQKGKNIILWIFAALIIFALIYMFWTFSMMS